MPTTLPGPVDARALLVELDDFGMVVTGWVTTDSDLLEPDCFWLAVTFLLEFDLVWHDFADELMQVFELVTLVVW